MFKFKTLTTTSNGTIYHVSDLAGIQPQFTLERTMGNEFAIKHGDIQISHVNPIPRTFQGSTDRYWLGVYDDGDNIVDAFLVPEDGYDEKNDNPPYLYQTRLKSIQNIFFDDLGNQPLEYSSDPSEWNYALLQSIVSIKKLRIKVDGSNTSFSNDVAGFSIGDIVGNLFSGHNNNCYDLISVNTGNNIPFANSSADDVPVLFRGQSWAIGFVTNQDIVNNTFKEDPDNGESYGMTWKDIFLYLSFIWNSLFSSNVSIIGNVLSLSLTMLIRKDIDYIPLPIVPKWSVRKKELRKYKVDRIEIKAANFTYKRGALTGVVFEKSIDIGNPEKDVSFGERKLYLSSGDFVDDYAPLIERYDVLDINDNHKPWFTSPLVGNLYSDMLSSGHGYKGRIDYQGNIDVGTIIQVSGEFVMVMRWSYNNAIEGSVNIEGIVVG